MKTNIVARRSFLIVYLIVALITNVIYGVADYFFLSEVDVSTLFVLSISWMLTLFLSFGLFLFSVLFFGYPARQLFWFLFPFVGGMSFAFRALFSKKNPEDFRVSAKTWSILVLLGLMLLDQTTGSAIFVFDALNTGASMPVWQLLVDVVLLAATVSYFIYWGRKRQIAQWSWRNVWKYKWGILLAVAIMSAFDVSYPCVLSLFHISIPTGGNQAALDAVAKTTPPILMWLHLAIGAPVMEETIFRVGIFELLSPKHPKTAFLISASLFALVHMLDNLGAISLWPMYLAPALVLSGLYYKSRKVETSAAVHFFWNGLLSYVLP